MIRYFSGEKIDRIRERLIKLYGDDMSLLERLNLIVGRFGVGLDPQKPEKLWDQHDNVLITYGDMVQSKGEMPFVTLKRFLNNYLKDIVDTVHILPFFPFSSDDGFSIIDYRTVDPSLGSWFDIESIGKHFNLMFDLVINHVSQSNTWFKDYTAGVAPARNYFIEVDPGTDLSAVMRPRSTPLLTKTNTINGERYVWTTFSKDQVDVDFSNSDVLFEYLEILLWYIANGARIIRLDAIAYLWKEIGTSCIHHPNTHEIVKLIRDILGSLAPHVLLLTETNVPNEENLSYFGDGDEAHIIYQFSLPPLLLHALQTGNAKYLTDWAKSLPTLKPGMTFLNFTASHDGIGVRPLRGLIPQEEFDDLITEVKERGGTVSMKKNPDGTESPYELNITYFDALSDPEQNDSELDVARFLCSQVVAMSLKGIPAAYFHSLTATHNDQEGVKNTGRARSINRKKWNEEELIQLIDDKGTVHYKVFHEYRRLLELRSGYKAFHPDGLQEVLNLDDRLFAIKRFSPDGNKHLFSISNVTSQKIGKSFEDIPSMEQVKGWKDIISGEKLSKIALKPYQTVWLVQSE